MQDCLLGTNNLPSIIEIGDEKFQLGEVVRLSFLRSGLSVSMWNELEYWIRDKLLIDEVDRIKRTLLQGKPFDIL